MMTANTNVLDVKNPVEEPVKQATVIMAEIMASFGAGYAVQANRETAIAGDLPDPAALPKEPPPINPPTFFADPGDLETFELQLLGSAIANRAQLPWNAQNSQRRFILKMAFIHGMFARLLVTKQKLPALTPDVLERSLRLVQKWCSPGGGGGPACPF